MMQCMMKTAKRSGRSLGAVVTSRILYWLLILALICAVLSLVGAALHQYARGDTIDIPETCRVEAYRWSGRGYSCGWTAMEICLRTGGEPEVADWWHAHHGGAAKSSHIAAALDKINGIDYYRARGKDWSIFDVADALGLPAYVSAERGRHHAVVYAGRFQRADGTWMVCVLDGRQKTYKWDWWAKKWGGNAIMPILQPPPPEPRVQQQPTGTAASYVGSGRLREPVTVELSDHPTIREMHREAVSRRGGRAIALDEECCRIAQRWANTMARTGKFRHGGGEQIIAKGYRSVEACFDGWMTSRGHRAWVLTSKTRAGWGYQRSASGRCYWAGAFRWPTRNEHNANLGPQ